MTLILNFILVIGVPLFLNWMIIFRRFHNGWFLLSFLLFTLFYVVTDFFVADWHWWSYWAIFIIGLMTFLALINGIRKFSRVSWERPSYMLTLASIFMFLGAGYFLTFDYAALRAIKAPTDSIELSFPMKSGTYSVVQGGSAQPLQFAHADSVSQKYAVDLVVINEHGVSSGAYLDPATRSVISTGTPVYSPCEGEAVWTRDGISDRADPNTDTPFGNGVAISCRGVIVTLAHFQKGSVNVKRGELVKTGKMLGRIGSSGDTVEAHLHIHAEKGEFQGERSNNPAVGMSFDGAHLWKNRLISN